MPWHCDGRQSAVAAQSGETCDLPVMHFTQVLALALGCGSGDLRPGLHAVDLHPVLRDKGLLEPKGIGEPVFSRHLLSEEISSGFIGASFATARRDP